MKIQNKQLVNENGVVRMEISGMPLVVAVINPPVIQEYNGRQYKRINVVLKDTPDHEYVQHYKCEVSEARLSVLNGVSEGDTVEAVLQLAGGEPKPEKDNNQQMTVFNVLRILELKVIRKGGGQVVNHTPVQYTQPAQPASASAPAPTQPADDLPF